MSKLNAPGTNTNNQLGVSANGNVQSVKKAHQQLFEIVVGTMYSKDAYYESNDDRLKRLRAAVIAVVTDNTGPDFIANVIYTARTQFNMRTFPVVLAVEFALALRQHNMQYDKMRKVVRDVIQRPDEITDMMAYALSVFGDKKKIPVAIKKGVGDAFSKFNEYQFAKWNNTGGAVKMTDVIRIVHPVPQNELSAMILDKMMNEVRREDAKTASGTLETPYTWETELSELGKVVAEQAKAQNVQKDTPAYEQLLAQAKKNKWEELIDSNKVGYMAMLRNLRNILDAKVSDAHIKKACDFLSDPKQVEKSKQLPFRFINAYESIEGHGNNKVKNAINKALDASLSNLPKLGENVWIIMDVSSSMGGGYASNMAPIKIAGIFASALYKACADSNHVKLTCFSDRAAHINLNPSDSIQTMIGNIRSAIYGGGTNLEAALALKPTLGFEPDTVILLSDMEVNSFYGYSYDWGRAAGQEQNLSKLFDKDCLKLAFNFNASETTPVGEKHGWYQLAGFSEAIFKMAPAMRGAESIVKQLSVPYKGE